MHFRSGCLAIYQKPDPFVCRFQKPFQNQAICQPEGPLQFKSGIQIPSNLKDIEVLLLIVTVGIQNLDPLGFE